MARASERAKKARKKSKKTLIIIILLIVVIAIVAIIKGRKKEDTPEVTIGEQKMVGTQLQDTTYEEMKVKNIVLEYLEANNETMVSMVIENTTSRNVEKEKVIATFLNADGKQLTSMPTTINSLQSGKECSISIVIKGNLTETTNITLKKDV